nr:5499_t:CDS:2 [Entrophospora candida]
MSSINDDDEEETNSQFFVRIITNDRLCRDGDEWTCQVKIPVSLERPNGLCGKRLPNLESKGQTEIRVMVQKKSKEQLNSTYFNGYD